MFRFTAPDMTCGGCARRVNNALLSVDPAADVT
ncbi:heavy-metal-associated domain-containing protein, partial [Brucella lupini]